MEDEEWKMKKGREEYRCRGGKEAQECAQKEGRYVGRKVAD